MAVFFNSHRGGKVVDTACAVATSRAWRLTVALLLCLLIGGFPCAARGGTLVNFNTTVGSLTRTIQVDLFDDVTPQTVANFLRYVNANRYVDIIAHRLEPGFVIQGGGFNTADFEADPLPFEPAHIPTFPSPQNEFQISNGRAGTIAMAKRGGDPNSATSEWFFNLGDNAANLDNQNGGFTVFGWTVGDGMSIVNSIAGLTPTVVPFIGASFTRVPQDAQGNFVNFDSITVAMTHPSFQNPIMSTDVNNDGQTTPNDLGIVINSLLANGSHAASAEFLDDTYVYFDPNGDGAVRPSDALNVINFILSQPSAAPLSARFAAPMRLVPEPSSLSLAAAAALAFSAVALARRRRRKRAAAPTAP